MRLRFLLPLVSVFFLHCGSCSKTPELTQADSGADTSLVDAASTNASDAGATSTKGRPRNLSVEHGTAGLRTKLNACYATALATHPDEKGGTELSIFIAADGHVKEAKVTGSTLSNDTLDCLRRTTETFGFDPLDKDTAIMIPLYFGPRPDAGSDLPDGGRSSDRRRRWGDAGAAY